MVEVYGAVPEYQGVERPPTLKCPQPGWQYLQVVKQRENGRVVGISLRVIFRELEMYQASAAWEDLYNFARPVKTLRMEVRDDAKRRWKLRTPAMAAGLTDHIWSVKELLTTVVLPTNT
jgi:hypothetical protein